MKTRAVLLREPGKLEITERELTLGEDEVLVKTEFASICGTDKNGTGFAGLIMVQGLKAKGQHGSGGHL